MSATATINTMVVSATATLNTLVVSATSTLKTIVVSGTATVGDLKVSNTVTLPNLTVSGTCTLGNIINSGTAITNSLLVSATSTMLSLVVSATATLGDLVVDGRGLGKVLQVVHTTTTSETQTTNTSFVTTSLSLDILPASSASVVNIGLHGNLNIGGTRGNWCYWTIFRFTSGTSTGTNISGEDDGFGGLYIEQDGANFDLHVPMAGFYVDSPNTNVTATYVVMIRVTGGTGKFNQNQPHKASMVLSEIGA